jgi:iron complex outermembrane receptor protein
MRLLPILAGSAFAAAAAAQTPDTVSHPRAAAADSLVPRLAPVNVLGERLPSGSPLDAPLALSRVRRSDRFGTTGLGINDALVLVPGVVAQSRAGSGDVRVVIRGFGARGAGDRSNAGTTRGIRVLLDGFPSTEPDGRTSFDDVDLAVAEGVDVLRSNASSTWGNAAGGVVSVSTVPEARGRFATAEPFFGSFGLQRYAFRGGAPLGSGSIFASVVQSRLDGWRRNSASDRLLLNVGALTPLGERTRLSTFLVASRNQLEIPGPLTRAQAEADPRQANAGYATRHERRDNRVGRLGLALEQDVGDSTDITARLFVNPKNIERSERNTYRDFDRQHLGGSVLVRHRARVGGRAQSGTVLAGGDYAAQSGPARFYSLTPEGERGSELRTDKSEGATNAGGFVSYEHALGRVRATLGGRYDAIAYDYRDRLLPALDARKTFSRVTPKLAVNYRPSATRSLYASYGGGVEAPAGNEVDPAGTEGLDTVTAINPLLEPIHSTTYEAGTKQLLAFGDAAPVRSVSYDAALYYTDVRNEIVPYRGGRFYFTAGRTRRTGAELALSARAAGGVSLQTALAYSSNRYRDYVVDSVHYGKPGATADYGGNTVIGVPAGLYSAALAAAPGWMRGGRAQLAVQGATRYFADDANAVRVPGYTITSLTLGLDAPRRVARALPLRGFVTVNNLFDRRYIASAFLNPDVVAGAPVAFEPGLPRSVVVALTLGR